MGKVTWNGFQNTVENAPQPVSIVTGRNLRSSSTKKSEPSKTADQRDEEPELKK